MIRKSGWALMTVLALFVALYAIALCFIPDMRPPFLRDRFSVVPLAVIMHLGGAAVAIAVGPFQLNAGLRNRFIAIHRWMGRAYAIGVLVGGLGALILATRAQFGLPSRVGFGLLAVLWLTATAQAYRSIRARNQPLHRRWMIRSYALTFAAVMLRIYLPLSQVYGIPFEPAYQTIAWLCWVPNLIVAEWLILRQPVAAVEAPAHVGI
jgi:uncharacterized membrane protein